MAVGTKELPRLDIIRQSNPSLRSPKTATKTARCSELVRSDLLSLLRTVPDRQAGRHQPLGRQPKACQSPKVCLQYRSFVLN